jgi:hypothetical protein
VDELAVNLAAESVDHGYLQFLVVPQAAVADALCRLFAMLDRSASPARLRDSLFSQAISGHLKRDDNTIFLPIGGNRTS